LLLAEAQSLHRGWENITHILFTQLYGTRIVGADPVWDSLVAHAYDVFVIFYILPEPYADWLLKAYPGPPRPAGPTYTFPQLPPEPELVREVELIRSRADEANAAIIRANLRLVVSVAKRYLGRGMRFWT